MIRGNATSHHDTATTPTIRLLYTRICTAFIPPSSNPNTLVCLWRWTNLVIVEGEQFIRRTFHVWKVLLQTFLELHVAGCMKSWALTDKQDSGECNDLQKMLNLRQAFEKISYKINRACIIRAIFSCSCTKYSGEFNRCLLINNANHNRYGILFSVLNKYTSFIYKFLKKILEKKKVLRFYLRSVYY